MGNAPTAAPVEFLVSQPSPDGYPYGPITCGPHEMAVALGVDDVDGFCRILDTLPPDGAAIDPSPFFALRELRMSDDEWESVRIRADGLKMTRLQFVRACILSNIESDESSSD